MSARTARRGPAALLALCGLALALVTGCSGSDGSGDTAAGTVVSTTAPATGARTSSAGTSSAGTTAPDPVVVHISEFAYRVPDSVSPGATVSVMNMDGVAHTVTADDGGFDVQVPAGQTVTFTAPTTAGSYAFTCTYHANMHGVLVVA